MADKTNNVPASSSALLIPYLTASDRHFGSNITEAALRQTGMERVRAVQSPILIPYKLQAKFADMLSKISGVSYVGALLASNTQYHQLGPYADFVLTAPTLGEALRQGSRALSSVAFNIDVRLIADGEKCFIAFECDMGSALGKSQVEEATVMQIINLFRCYTNPRWTPDLVCLTAESDLKPTPKIDMYGTEVSLREGPPGFWFSSSILTNRAVKNREHSSRKILTTEELQRAYGYLDLSKFSNLVKNVILMNLTSSRLSAHYVAQSIGLGVRTMQRRLMVEGETFQSCLDQARLQRAGELLQQTDLTVEQISHHLGYVESNSFRRAFKKWHGISPSDYRARI
jgi:AraC-like DNA-binding protein